MVDVLIFYEGVEREYENDTLLRLELERRGYKVSILNTTHADYFKSFFINSKVTVVHTIRNNRNVHFYTRSLFGKPKALVDMQYEQVFAKSVIDSGTELPRDKACNTYHVCWGRKSAERLREIGVSDNYIWQAGAIQLDLLRPEFRSYYRNRESLAKEFGFDYKKRLILFNANFPYVTYSDEQINDLVERKGLTYLRKKRENQILAQAELVKWFDKLLSTSKDIEFIYRPHPTEKPSNSIIELDVKYENFHIIGSYSVKQWIVVSDVINVWDSTSIVEAYFCGKHCNICWPFRFEQEELIGIFDDCKPILSQDKFVEENISQCNTYNDVLSKDIFNELYGYTGKSATYKYLADQIENIINDTSVKENYKVPLKLEYIKHEWYFFVRSIFAELFNRFGFRLSIFSRRKKESVKRYEDSLTLYSKKYLDNKYYNRLKEVFDRQ